MGMWLNLRTSLHMLSQGHDKLLLPTIFDEAVTAVGSLGIWARGGNLADIANIGRYMADKS
jgi:hypothetical protein